MRSMSGLCGDAPIFLCTWTPYVVYPGDSGICAPCSTGIAWANIGISEAVARHAPHVLPLWWYPPKLSKAEAWHALRVWSLWWYFNFWMFQDPQCWLSWWKWDTRSVFHWHCMGQHCYSLVMKLTGLWGGFSRLLLLYYDDTKAHYEKQLIMAVSPYMGCPDKAHWMDSEDTGQ